MPTPRVTVESNYQERAFVAVFDALVNYAPALKEAVRLIQQGIADNFANEGSAEGPWKELAPLTRRTRRRLRVGEAHPILYRGRGGPDGRVLRDALLSPDAVHYETDYVEVTYPNPGDPRFRALSKERPMLPLGPVYEREIAEVLIDWFASRR